MKRNVSPWWIVVIAVFVVAGVYLVTRMMGLGREEHATHSTLEELAKQKSPVDAPPLQEGGVIPGSGMAAPTLKGGQ